ncbi:hybrid sensor histidine kinase/response regulator [Falsiroseomonas sp.]|uniref:hybrid sensor histidine kinase/response regulator n=1 Tax=Falsiroseomonas sp. TaxID=2870721 RepID=UPI002719A3AC|nr:hybrid sensor histidine kinase/response regulator [Falsiroseomonas sp.]MDO9502986.1 hybrid sensor histidine kinase/response regulator [Falsiroseomonas sp.]MDP3414703.1 hybrid sensor histidine kinase/response regulator [Falsiroseomonas sp.]
MNPSPADSTARTAPGTPPPLSVLVLDDERPIVELLVRGLSQRGFLVHGVHDTAAAKVAIDADPGIGVLLSDVRMPGQTGLALAEELLRDREEARALEVVLLTGGATADVALGALRARTFDLVQKPLRLAEVAAVVERALASCRQRRARALRDAEVDLRIGTAEAERARLVDRLSASSARLDDVRSALAASQRMRSDLLAVISHEMRTPLIPILGFSEILAGDMALPAAEVRDYGRLIHSGARRLLSLIEAALDIVALEHGRGLGAGLQEPVPRLLTRVLAAQEPEAAAQGVRLELAHGESQGLLNGDLRLLAAALSHLLDNAIKASPQGATVLLGWSVRPDQGIDILVRDHGAGLPDGLESQIGTPFLQADMSLTRNWPGAGLGLALVTRVAAAHGGRLHLRAADGGGTEACLELPAARHPAAA